MIERRLFLTGLVALVATAPSIAKAALASPPPLATVNASYQTGVTLIVSPLSGSLQAGDIITIEGVYAVNRIDPDREMGLREFVVTADADIGHTAIHLYPPIIQKSQARGSVQELPRNSAEVQMLPRMGGLVVISQRHVDVTFVSAVTA